MRQAAIGVRTPNRSEPFRNPEGLLVVKPNESITGKSFAEFADPGP
jgi:hypothetical protein